MRIFFIGTVKFSYVTLKTLLESGADVVGVATKSESKFNADFEDLRPLCETYNIPYKVVKDINHPNNVAFIRKLLPEVIYCFGWSNLLGTELLNLTPKGVVGFHPARIPENKGRHPIIWTLCLGLKTTASTFFFMDEGADTGDILSQQEILVAENDDASSLYHKITQTAITQILDFTTKLELGINERTKQIGLGNTWRKRGRRDGEIDFRMSSNNIFNLVRALTRPYVGAHVMINGDEYKIWKAAIVQAGSPNDEPGKIVGIDSDGLIIKTGDGAIKILEHDIKEVIQIGSYL